MVDLTMRWSERRTAVCSHLRRLPHFDSERRALSAAVAHLILVRRMLTPSKKVPILRDIRVALIIMLCLCWWSWYTRFPRRIRRSFSFPLSCFSRSGPRSISRRALIRFSHLPFLSHDVASAFAYHSCSRCLALCSLLGQTIYSFAWSEGNAKRLTMRWSERLAAMESKI